MQRNKRNESAQHLTQIIVYFTISVNKAISPTSNQILHRICAKNVRVENSAT